MNHPATCTAPQLAELERRWPGWFITWSHKINRYVAVSAPGLPTPVPEWVVAPTTAEIAVLLAEASGTARDR